MYMLYKTHVLTSIAGALVISNSTHVDFSVALAGGVILGSLLPDVDEDGSFIGRKTLGVSKIIKMIFGHRGITHSLFAWFLFSIPYLISHNSFLLGLSLGYLFHILGDMFSKSGVPLLYPSKKRFKIPIYRTGGPSEYVIFLSTILFIFFFIF
jgi:inner membrane protein